MPINAGILREDEFVYFLDGKKAKSISKNLQSMMERLFGIVDSEKKISCVKTQDYIKPDIIITHRKIEKAVSIKSSSSHVMHNEQIKTFILFLRSLGISTKTQQTILLYQYGDGTMDGTGTKRHCSSEVQELLKDRIKEANDELNDSKDIIKAAINRVIFDGVVPEARKADAIYHGDVKKGVVVTREQMMKHIDKKEKEDWYYTRVLHIGPLILTPAARYVDRPEKDGKKRHIIECIWTKFAEDMEYISMRYTYYSSPFLWKKQ